MKVINNHRQPLTLDSGIILAAAGTKGSEREVESISDHDRRRYVDTGRIAVFEDNESGNAVPASVSDKGDDEPTSIAGVIARDVVKAARKDARKKAEEEN